MFGLGDDFPLPQSRNKAAHGQYRQSLNTGYQLPTFGAAAKPCESTQWTKLFTQALLPEPFSPVRKKAARRSECIASTPAPTPCRTTPAQSPVLSPLPPAIKAVSTTLSKFRPGYDWSSIPQGMGVPPGLEIKMQLSVDGSGLRTARIPPRWQLQVVSTDCQHACRVEVVRGMHLAEVRRLVAEMLRLDDDGPQGVSALLVDGVQVAGGAAGASGWSLTVEEAQLFGSRVTFERRPQSNSHASGLATPDLPEAGMVRSAYVTNAVGSAVGDREATSLQSADDVRPAGFNGGTARRKSFQRTRRRRTSWLPRKQAELFAKNAMLSATHAIAEALRPALPRPSSRTPQGQEPPVRRRRRSFVARKQAELRAQAAQPARVHAPTAGSKRNVFSTPDPTVKPAIRRRRTSFAVRKMVEIAANQLEGGRRERDIKLLVRRAVATPMALVP